MVHDPDHVITRLDQFTNFECENVDVLVTIRAAREPLPSELESSFCQVANLDSIINVLGDVVDCGGLSREDTSGKIGDVLLDANVGHFMKIAQKIIVVPLPVELEYLCTG